MSKSRKKQPFYSANAGAMKAWKQSANRRYRQICNNLLKTVDFDELVIPNFKRITCIYDSPKDGMMSHQTSRPCECEFDSLQGYYIRGVWKYYGIYKLDETGHHVRCFSKFNPNSRYWKVYRK